MMEEEAENLGGSSEELRKAKKGSKKRKRGGRKADRTASKENADFKSGSTEDAGLVRDRSNEGIKNASKEGMSEKGKEGVVERAERLGLMGMEAEFNELRTSKEEGDMHAHRRWEERNRYKDVGCWDHSRVILQDPVIVDDGSECDYIHASWVDGPRCTREYICTQGPLEGTEPEFWHMVWEQRVATIVMLCLCVETGKEKCSTYFPTEDEKVFPTGYRVRCRSRDSVVLQDYKLVQLHLEIRKEGEERPRNIVHIIFANWADRGLPPSPNPMAFLLKSVHSLHEEMARSNGNLPSESPKLVHCSAGVGRTGTFVLVDIALATPNHPLVLHLSRLRQQRRHAVQTIEQYLFAYAVLISAACQEEKRTPPIILKTIVGVLARAPQAPPTVYDDFNG